MEWEKKGLNICESALFKILGGMGDPAGRDRDDAANRQDCTNYLLQHKRWTIYKQYVLLANHLKRVRALKLQIKEKD